MFGFLLAPGRLATRLLQDKNKRRYRSAKPPRGPMLIIVSVIFWAALIACGFLLYAFLHENADTAAMAPASTESGQADDGARPADLPTLSAPLGQNGEGPTPRPAPGATGDASGVQQGAAPSAPAQPGAPAVTARAEVQRGETWLVILNTMPKDARAEAERRQAQYKSKGLKTEIMDTDAFPRMLPGFWIIALGPFETRDDAATAANAAKKYNSGLVLKRAI